MKSIFCIKGENVGGFNLSLNINHRGDSFGCIFCKVLTSKQVVCDLCSLTFGHFIGYGGSWSTPESLLPIHLANWGEGVGEGCVCYFVKIIN